ncbi:hypothetical protein [Thalassotalea atypica]|uniref:hypothetical protein n=1 Tax=Thalassotalea atypica TaxID=2054316 RepID=UPI0025729535|nr:hypothetical protein [Thalassotalea atypica]
MSFITKFSNLFAKTESANMLGVAFRKDAIAYCFYAPGQKFKTNQLPVEQENYLGALKSVLAQKSITANVQLVLSSSQYQMVQVDKPNIPDDEINAALKWQVKDLVTVEPEDMIVDYFSGPIQAGGAEKINVVCARKSSLAPLVEQFEKSGLSLKSITTEEFAFAGLLPHKEQAVLLVCQQPNEEIVILIVKASQIYFHRRLRGYTQIANKTPEELSFGIIDSLSLEIQRSMDYFERQLKQPPIKDIQLLLPIKAEQYLASKLAENTLATVNVLSLDETQIENRAYAVAYGAATLINGGEQQ